MRAQENISFQNISATPARFTLSGGRYQLAVVAIAFRKKKVAVRQLGPNGVTMLPASGNLAANGLVVFDVPPGIYELTITTATNVYACVTRIPGE